MPGPPLLLPEREEISVALISDPEMSWAEIARRVHRHPTTVSREVVARGGRDRYRPAVAQRDAERARCRPRARVLEVKATDCLRSRRPRRRSRQARRPNARPALPNIGRRPEAVNDRCELGHWEGDQIIGAANRSSLLTLTERVTRYSIGITMPEGYTAEAMLGGLTEGLDRIPAHLLRSLTLDQGSEWARWSVIAATYNIDMWFCDPHAPWQRGQIENLNRQWRWWFPRGMRLDDLEPTEVDRAAGIINGQRRRHLAYQSPASLYAAATVQ